MEQLDERFDAQTGLTDDRAQGPAIELRVIRDDELREWLLPSKNDVAAGLAANEEPCPSERIHAVTTRDARELGHTATTRVSKRSAGTGRLSSSSAAMYTRIASRTLLTASSRVAPWLMHPGKLGHSATQ